MTHPEHELPKLKTTSKADDSDHPALASRQSGDRLNPKCMTKQDWVEAQSKDKTIGKMFHLHKSKKYTVVKSIELTKMR